MQRVLLWVALLIPFGMGLSHAQTSPSTQPIRPASTVSIEHILPKKAHIVVSTTQLEQLIYALQSTPLYTLYLEPEIRPLVHQWLHNWLHTERLIRRNYRRRLRRNYRRRLRRRYRRRHYHNRKRRRIARLLGKKRKDSRFYLDDGPPKSALTELQELSTQLTGFKLWDLARIFKGRHALSLINVPNGSEPLEVAAIFGISDRQKAQKLLVQLFKRIPFKKEQYTYKGIHIRTLKGMENALHFAFFKQYILCATTRNVIQKMLDNAKGGQQSLHYNTKYTQFKKNIGIDHHLSVYFNVTTITQIVAATLGNSRKAFIHSVLDVIRSSDSAGVAIGIQKKRFTTRWYIRNQKGKTSSRPFVVDTSLLQTAPQKLLAGFIIRIPWLNIWQQVQQKLQKHSPRQYMELQRTQQYVEKGILERTVAQSIQSLGENSALYAWSNGGLIPQVTWVQKLNNAQVVRTLFFRLARLAKLKLHTQTYRGVRYTRIQWTYRSYRAIRKFRMIRGLFRQFGKWGVVAFSKDQMWMTLRSQTMRNFIDVQHDQTSARKKAIRRYTQAARNTIAWSYFAPRSWFLQAYNTATPVLSFSPLRRLIGRFAQTHKIPRGKVIARHIVPASASLKSYTTSKHTRYQATTRSGLGLELIALTGMASSALEKLFLQFKVRYYIRASVRFLTLEKESNALQKKGLYALAVRRWSAFAKRYSSQVFHLIARKRIQHFKQLLKLRNTSIQKQLKKDYAGQIAQTQHWFIQNDWSYTRSIWKAITHKKAGSSLFFGSSELSHYVLQFEVRNPTKGFDLSLHTQNKVLRADHTRYVYGSYKWQKKLYFGHRQFKKDQWTPIKIKVKGSRISYWLGFKHRVVRSFSRKGRIGFIVPPNGRLELRNIRILVAQTKSPKQAAVQQPSLHIRWNSSARILEKGQRGTLKLRIRNMGSLPAHNVRIRFQIPKQLQILSLRQGSRTIQTKKGASGQLVLPSILLIEGHKSLQIQLSFITKTAGSAEVSSFIRFQPMQGDIVVSRHLHITR